MLEVFSAKNTFRYCYLLNQKEHIWSTDRMFTQYCPIAMSTHDTVARGCSARLRKPNIISVNPEWTQLIAADHTQTESNTYICTSVEVL